MSFNLLQLLLIGLAYLSVLFGVAYATTAGWVPRQWVNHPATYILSLGVYASAWALFGSVGLAYENGFGFLAYYLGVCGAFLLAPVLLVPILRITRTFQLSSLADLLAFRYRSAWVGTTSALVILVSGIILIALQIQIVTSTIKILAPHSSKNTLGILFCFIMVAFAIMFGATRTSENEKSEGLIVAIAFESIVKLVAFLAIGFFAIYEIFGGFTEMNEWLDAHGKRVSAFERHLDDGPWRALLLIFFASAIVAPHMFHMTFKENLSPRSLYKASWGVPLYLFLISLPIPPILWAAIKTGSPTIPDYFTLGITITTNSPVIAVIAYIGGLSAASALIIVTTLALSSISLNHIILPIYRPLDKANIYSWLKWIKSALTFSILAAAYLFYYTSTEHLSLATLSTLTSSAGLQLLPAVLAVLFWPIGQS